MKIKTLFVVSLSLLLASCGNVASSSSSTTSNSSTSSTSSVTSTTSSEDSKTAAFSFEDELVSLKKKIRFDSYQQKGGTISTYNDGEYLSVKTMDDKNEITDFHTYKFVEEDTVIEEYLGQDNEIHCYTSHDILVKKYLNPFSSLDSSKAKIEGEKVKYEGSSIAEESQQAFAYYLFGNEAFDIKSIEFTFSKVGNSFEAVATTNDPTYAELEDGQEFGEEEIITTLTAKGTFSYGDEVVAFDHHIVKVEETENSNGALEEAFGKLKENNYTLTMETDLEKVSEKVVSTSSFYSNDKEAYYYDEEGGNINQYSFDEENQKWKLVSFSAFNQDDNLADALNMPSFDISKDCFKFDKDSQSYVLKEGIIFDMQSLCKFDSDNFNYIPSNMTITLGEEGMLFSFKETVDTDENGNPIIDTISYSFTKIGETETDFDPSKAITPSYFELKLEEEEYESFLNDYGKAFINAIPVIDTLKNGYWSYKKGEDGQDSLASGVIIVDALSKSTILNEARESLVEAGFAKNGSNYYSDSLLEGYRIIVTPSFVNVTKDAVNLVYLLSKTVLN